MVLNALTAFAPTFLWIGNDPIACSFLDFIFSLTICLTYRKSMDGRTQPWLQTLVACFIGVFGGTIMTSIALGVPIMPLSTKNSPLAYLAAWWLVFCSPVENHVYSIFAGSHTLMLIVNLINCVSAGQAVTTWGAEKALKNVHLAPSGSGPLTILAGTLSASGGGFLSQWFGISGSAPNWAFGTPPTLQKPSTIVKNAFWGSVIYYLLRNPHGYLPWQHHLIPHGEAGVVIWLLWTVVFLLQYSGMQDPYEAVSTMLHTHLVIPPVVPRSTPREHAAEHAEDEHETYRAYAAGAPRGGMRAAQVDATSGTGRASSSGRAVLSRSRGRSPAASPSRRKSKAA